MKRNAREWQQIEHCDDPSKIFLDVENKGYPLAPPKFNKKGVQIGSYRATPEGRRAAYSRLRLVQSSGDKYVNN